MHSYFEIDFKMKSYIAMYIRLRFKFQNINEKRVFYYIDDFVYEISLLND
jgi:hypothetical protein